MTKDNNKNSTDNMYQNSLLKYILIFLKYKKIIIWVTLIVGIITTILAFFVIKPVYLSTSTIKASGSSSSGLGGLLSSSGISGLGGLDDLTGGGSITKELALYEEILISRRCIEDIIVKFDLMSESNFRFMQDAVKDFRENTLSISKNLKAGTIQIGIYDIYPQRAKDIADYIILSLNNINTDMNVQNAKNNREFIEKRYEVIKKDLKFAEDSLKEYQEQYGFAPDVVTKTIIQTEIQLEVEIKSEELKLELLKKMLTSDQAEVKMQEAKILTLKKQLEEIRKSNDKSSNIRLKGAPDIVLNYLRLMRNVEIQNKLLTYIIPIYEQAKIEEKKETPSVIILDSPSLPEYKKKPKRLVLIALSILATFSSLAISFITYEMFLKNLIYIIKKEKRS